MLSRCTRRRCTRRRCTRRRCTRRRCTRLLSLRENQIRHRRHRRHCRCRRRCRRCLRCRRRRRRRRRHRHPRRCRHPRCCRRPSSAMLKSSPSPPASGSHCSASWVLLRPYPAAVRTTRAWPEPPALSYRLVTILAHGCSRLAAVAARPPLLTAVDRRPHRSYPLNGQKSSMSSVDYRHGRSRHLRG